MTVNASEAMFSWTGKLVCIYTNLVVKDKNLSRAKGAREILVSRNAKNDVFCAAGAIFLAKNHVIYMKF